MKIIDIHTHTDYINPDATGVVCCATKESDWKKIINLMETDNRVYGAFGIHPWFVQETKNNFDVRLKQLLENNSNYMIGEIGLDKYKPDMEKQMDVFMKQFDLAVKLKRNIFLHCVGAWDKIFYILKQYDKQNLPIIIAHNFNASMEITQKLLQYDNIMFSFGENALYGKNCRIEQIPSNRILIETDGKKDVVLKDIVTKISEIKNDKDIPNIIYNNTKRVLKNG